jgi:hypothetical protein
LLIVSAEDGQRQEKHIEDVEENRGGEERRGADVLSLAQPLEIDSLLV